MPLSCGNRLRTVQTLTVVCCFLTLFCCRSEAQPAGKVRVVAGVGRAGYSGDGAAASKATLSQPFAVCFNNRGELLIADTANHCVRKIDHNSVITTIVGTGAQGYTGDGGPADRATLNEPYAVACDAEGNLFIADRLNACIRFVNTKGLIFTLAGTGSAGYSGDGGIATRAQLREPTGLALDGKHGLFISDTSDNRIRCIDLRSGIITTTAGNGSQSGAGDGDLATEASINGARAVALTPKGNLLVCERSGNRIREIEQRLGIIRTIAGTGKPGYMGDGRASILAAFNGPKWVECSSDGTIYVVDTENHCIRSIAQDTGVVRTVAGDGHKGPEVSGNSVRLSRPHGCCVHDGTLYIADTENNRVLAIALK